MKIEFLYFPDCPSHERALQLLQEVLEEEGVSDPIQIYCVETEEQVQLHRFVGSPTIRINGQDIDPRLAPATPYRLTCRLYLHEDSRPSPLPSRGMIQTAVRRALESSED